MRVKSEPDSGIEREILKRQSGNKANGIPGAPQHLPHKVPSVSASSRWDQPELGQSSLDTSLAAGLRFQGALDASEAVPDMYPQSMDLDALDGMARELDDSRQGSPCQRAAAELLEAGPYGEGMQPEVACLPPNCSDQGYAVPQQGFLAPGPSSQSQWPNGGYPPQPTKQEPWEGGPGGWGTQQQRQAQAWSGQPAQGGEMPLQNTVGEQYSMAQVPAFGQAQQTLGPLQQRQAQADHRVPGGNAGPQLGPAVPAYEGGDWLTFIVDQAFSVGLWGGNPGMEPMEQGRGHLSNGVPTSNGALQGRQGGPVELAPSGDESGARDGRSFYQMEMEAMLPQHCGPRGDGGAMQMQAGLGHISRDQQLQPNQAQQQQQQQIKQEPAHEMPRLQPVSLGMTSSGLSQMLACSAMEGMNDGPFRPPTRLPAGAVDKAAGNSRYPVSHPSMLQQSRLQLSLGLDAGTPIDLRSWGYGEESNNTGKAQGGDSMCMTSDPQEDGQRTMDCAKTSDSCSVGLSALMPLSSSVSLPAIKIGISPSASSRHKSLSLTVKAPALASPRHLWDNGCLTDGEGRVRPGGSNSHRPGLEEAAATRAECLERYREKKRRRLIHKTIRYHKRKVNADNRPRIKGRFVKSSDSKPDSGMEIDGSMTQGLATLAEVKEAAQNLAGEAFGDLLVPGQTRFQPRE